MRLTDAEKRAAIESMYLDMELFGRTCIPSMFKAPTPDFHREIYETLEDDTERHVLIVAPRGHAKSSLTKVMILHHIMYGGPERVVVVISRTQKHSIKLVRSIKKYLMTSKPLQYFFGDWGVNTARKWGEEEVILKNGTLLVPLGTGQQLRGVLEGDTRPTLIVIDDPEDEANTRTLESIDNNFEWILKSAIPAKDPQMGRIMVIGTVVAQNCTVERLAETTWFKKHWYKAITDFDKKEVLWPDWRPYEDLISERDAMQEVGKLHIWYQEYQNEVHAPEEQPIKKRMIQYYDGIFHRYEEEHLSEIELADERVPVNVFIGIDPASSLSKRADYSVVMVIGRAADDRIFVIDYFHDHVLPMDLGDKIVEMADKYHPLGVSVETVGYQTMLRGYVQKQRAFLPGIERENRPTGKKGIRLLGALTPWFAAKQVYLRPEHEGLKNELLSFNPERMNSHDDFLDGLYWALEYSYRSSKRAYQGEHKKRSKRHIFRAINWKTA